ncbi:MAG TPA: serine/threonine protein kinase [Chloroflexota bacterium]|nr:serine/threonine protein kinase [Chloroflexota bacterium]
MNEVLRPDQVVQTVPSGTACRVAAFLGGGNQGEVYRAELVDGAGGAAVALKWYLPGAATAEQRTAIEALVRSGPPDRRFLWPLELAEAPGVPGFGYVMPLREARYKGIVDLMKRRVEPTFRALTTAGLHLADSYLQLHARGLCYRDISFGNVFFDPDSGDVLICDTDNVGVDGASKGGVLGTPRFMAPEVVRGDALPSTQTDLFSLAVLLFYMLTVSHPLEGAREAAIKCLDLPAMTRLYGTEPLFVFDPRDDANRPVPGVHDNALAFWPLYPRFLRDLFTRAFTEGMADPQNGRVRESEWRAAMVRLRDAIGYCAACGAEHFYDADALRESGGRAGPCWACGAALSLPPRIRIGRQLVLLNHDTVLFPHHLDEARLYDFSRPAAAVTRHPRDPQVWGLQNLTAEKWTVAARDGAGGGTRDVPPGRSVTVASGTRIHFGRVEGEIRV